MIIELLVSALVAQGTPGVRVRVIDGNTQRPIDRAEVVMTRNGEEQSPLRYTLQDGFVRYGSLSCSDEIKFMARLSGARSGLSEEGSCQAFVPLKINVRQRAR